MKRQMTSHKRLHSHKRRKSSVLAILMFVNQTCTDMQQSATDLLGDLVTITDSTSDLSNSHAPAHMPLWNKTGATHQGSRMSLIDCLAPWRSFIHQPNSIHFQILLPTESRHRNPPQDSTASRSSSKKHCYIMYFKGIPFSPHPEFDLPSHLDPSAWHN